VKSFTGTPEVATAIFSDIHGNLEALQAVLADIATQGIRRSYCLGDVPGPGPDSGQCLDLVMERCQVVLRGECDQSDEFELATSTQAPRPNKQRERRWHFLAERPQSFTEGEFIFVHGSARTPLHEYVFPEDIYSQRKMERIFARVSQYSCMGHTHVPGIFTEDFKFLSPEAIDYLYPLDGQKTLCNVGSVGQPRDGDWRACYVVLKEHTICFRRIEYDVAARLRSR
jgi:predicted phosphodiesterase